MIQKVLIQRIMELVVKHLTKKHGLDTFEKRLTILEDMAHPKKELICKCCKEKENK